MKKLLTLTLCFILALSMTACGSSSGTPSTTESENPSADISNTEDMENTDKDSTESADTEADAKEDASSMEEEITDLTGTWWDTDSQRCYIVAEQDGDTLYVTVSWSSSASENTTWSMTAKEDSNGIFQYSDGSKTTIITTENSADASVEYEDGTGNFQYHDGSLWWNDDKEGIRNGCSFQRGDDDQEDDYGEEEDDYGEEEEDNLISLPSLTCSNGPEEGDILENHHSSDGSHSYIAMQADGSGKVFNISMVNTPESDDQEIEEFLEFAAGYVADGDVKNYTVTQNKTYSKNLSYPVYIVSWTSGSNEDTTSWYMYSVITDTNSCYYGLSFPEYETEAEKKATEYFDNVTLN